MSVLSEDFESGQGDWVPGNSGVPLPDPPGGVSSPTATVWELGTPDPVLLGGPPAAHSGTNCFGTDLDTSYADLTAIFLRSPSINLTTAAGATLTFWRFYDIETGFDWGRVRVLDAADDSEIAVLEETFDGTTNDWEEVSIKHLPDSNHWHYCLQLNIYKAILEAKYGIKVSEMQLVCLHPNNKNGNYQCMEMVDLSDEIAALFRIRSLEVS